MTVTMKKFTQGILGYTKGTALRLADKVITEAELAMANKKIEEQAAELKRLNEDLEQLSYIISHDLKAPVRNISSFMKLMSNRYSSLLPADGKEFINMSQSGSEKLAKQIDDVISYCRVNRNLPPVAEVNVNELVKTISMELRSRANTAKAEIKVEKELPLLRDVHSAMIYQVIHHLVVNGIKFNANPHPVICINFEDAGDMVRFSVSDNGIGIEKGFENKLFHLFKRLHTSDQFEGTGIGLALCKKILALYNGAIWYESEAGQGTTFYFTLPKHLVVSAIPQHPGFSQQQNIISKAA